MKQYYLNRNFVLLFAANLMLAASSFLLVTTMARYAMVAYDSAGSLAGLAAGIFLIGGLVGRVVSGRFANRVGHKRFAVISCVVMLVACVLYFASGVSYVLLLLVRFVHGVTFGIVGTVMPAMAISCFPKEHVGEGTGVYMVSTSLGTGIGPLAGILVTSGEDFGTMFGAVAVMAVLVLVCALLVTVGARDPQLAAEDRAASTSWRSFIDPGTLRISVFMLLVALSYSTINAFLNSYAIDLGLGVFAPFTFLIYCIGNLVFRPVCGRLMDRYGENVVLYPSIVSMAVGLLICAMAKSPLGILIVGVFMASGFGTSMSIGQAIAIKRVDPSKTALAIGTFFILCDGGCGIGPVCLGALIEPIGYRGMYLVAAAVCLAGLVYYHFVHGRRAKRAM